MPLATWLVNEKVLENSKYLWVVVYFGKHRGKIMEFIEARGKSEEIENLAYKIEDNKCIITWKWPRDIYIVYIYKIKVKDFENNKEIDQDNLKLYTREEYTNRGGYHEKIKEIEEFLYIVFPCIEDNDEKLLLVNQSNKKNEIIFCTGRKKIEYSIKEKNKLFSNKKKVNITIRSEALIEKDMICYVVNEENLPLNKEQGTIFHFPVTFQIGENILPEILINNNEYIDIFFTNDEYKKIYQLVYNNN